MESEQKPEVRQDVYQVVTVEDDAEISDLIGVVLASARINVLAADSGDSGLALVREARPDLVMLDVMMPGEMNGWGVYDAIRADPQLSKTPVIMLSVLRESPERRRAFADSPIDVYMTKPFDTLLLRDHVQRLLGCAELWQPPAPKVARVFRSFRQAAELDVVPQLPRQEPAQAPSLPQLSDDVMQQEEVQSILKRMQQELSQADDTGTATAPPKSDAPDPDQTGSS